MKKLITIACCFAFVAAALTGCLSSKDKNMNDMNNAPSTVTTTSSTTPTTEITTPSTIPDSGYMPDNDENSDLNKETQNGSNSNDMSEDMEGRTKTRTPQSQTSIPSTTQSRR